MLHFPSSNPANGMQKHGNLNATQQKSGSDPIFLKIEEELHDARRVHSHGQEEDLRLALDMVIHRVTELSSMLTEAYKTQADLEVQLNVAKSNLALVISNNEMLEDALRRDSTGSSRDVGWRRRSGKDGDVSGERQSLDEWQQVPESHSSGHHTQSNSAANSPQIANQHSPLSANGVQQGQEAHRFFRFRFASSSSNSRPTSRPSTPSVTSPQIPPHGTSPVFPPAPPLITKEVEDLNTELKKERSARQSVEQEKKNLEAELESLSQALFEEANKMVAVERIKLADRDEELKQLRTEKEALKSALQLVEGENYTLRQSSTCSSSPLLDVAQYENPAAAAHDHISPLKKSRLRSSSEIAIKSRPGSLTFEYMIPLPPSPPSEAESPGENDKADDSLPSSGQTLQSEVSNDSEVTPRKLPPHPLPPSSTSTFEYSSPWADAESPSEPTSPYPSAQAEALYDAALAMR